MVPVVIPTTSPAERDRSAELALFGLRHVVPELGARQGAGVRRRVTFTWNPRPIDRRRGAEGRGRPRPLPQEPQNQIGLTGGSDPPIAEIHVVNQCSSKDDRRRSTPAARRTPSGTNRQDLATVHDNVIPTGTAAVHLLHPEAHLLRALRQPSRGHRSLRPDRSRSARQPEQHGLLVPERRPRAVLALHDVVGFAAEVRHRERSPDNSINWSATPTTVINLDPGAVLYVQVDGRLNDPG